MSLMFSRRSCWDLRLNKLTELLLDKRRAGEPIMDLTNANPTCAGFEYPATIQDRLARCDIYSYQPDPAGLLIARRAVQAYYAERGIGVDDDRILLTASTSEAYSFLFKLLTDSGDQILVPQPSYPLFEFLAGLEHVETRSYPLHYDNGWHIDLDRLAAALTQRCRAIVLVHPNNPTGSFIKNAERRVLEDLAREFDLALIVDEVFADYAWGEDAERVASFAGRLTGKRLSPLVGAPTDNDRARSTEAPTDKDLGPAVNVPMPQDDSPSADAEVLTFTLSGLSKVMGLPQMKLGWIVVGGPEAVRREAWQRLEVIADTYLSVATPIQEALPQLLPLYRRIQAQIKARVMENYVVLSKRCGAVSAVDLLQCDGGWYATLAVPMDDEEAWSLALLRQAGVFVHPGYFFDFRREGFVVLSLLTEKVLFRQGVEGLLGFILADKSLR